MPIRLNDFEMPGRVVKEESSATATFGRYIAEPFEIGYARTIGNSLRRVLLSSIEGCAISSVKIHGLAKDEQGKVVPVQVPHEFYSLLGVKEDMTEIVLALKKVLLKVRSEEPQTIHVKRKGPCVVTAADLAAESAGVEVLNPSHHIATVNGSALSLPGIVNVTFGGVRNSELLSALDREGIAASSGSACSSGSVEPSHVLTAMGLKKEEVGSSVRFSLGRENTEKDVDETLAVLGTVLARLRESTDLFLRKKSEKHDV